MQRRFVDEYINNGGNQTKAYQDAGYAAQSPSAIRSGASRLRNKPEVIEAIKERIEPDEIKRMITNKEIIKELLSIVFGEQRTAIVDGQPVEMTPRISDQIDAIRTYNKMVPLNKEAELRLELLESQIRLNESRIGMAEEEEDRLGLDILSLTETLSGGDTDEED